MIESSVYLASPYSHDDPEIRRQRYELVCAQAGLLMRAGLLVFSPISHSHGISLYGELHATDWEYWKPVDFWHLHRMDELWVLCLFGWRRSRGVSGEIEEAKRLGKPVRYVLFGSVVGSPDPPTVI
jgi:hypothetical protein